MGYAWIHFRHTPYLNSEVIFKNSSINSGYMLTWLKNDTSNHLNPQRGRERERERVAKAGFKLLKCSLLTPWKKQLQALMKDTHVILEEKNANQNFVWDENKRNCSKTRNFQCVKQPRFVMRRNWNWITFGKLDSKIHTF